MAVVIKMGGERTQCKLNVQAFMISVHRLPINAAVKAEHAVWYYTPVVQFTDSYAVNLKGLQGPVGIWLVMQPRLQQKSQVEVPIPNVDYPQNYTPVEISVSDLAGVII